MPPGLTDLLNLKDISLSVLVAFAVVAIFTGQWIPKRTHNEVVKTIREAAEAAIETNKAQSANVTKLATAVEELTLAQREVLELQRQILMTVRQNAPPPLTGDRG